LLASTAFAAETEDVARERHRPRYHFVVPDSKQGPFDPNCNIYWKGRHHIFYIFMVPDERFPREIAAPFGHASSTDLVNWTIHPWALEPTPGGPDGQGRCWSGDGFMWNGRPAIAYWGDRGQTCLATSDDDLLIHWKKHPANPVIASQPVEGEVQQGDQAPYMWEENGQWYCIRGGYLPDEGDTVFLFKAKSEELVDWEYLHPLYRPQRRWTEPYEDMACPEFFPLGDKHVLLGLSHAHGAHYYIGRWENERFIPETHGRMNWPGGRYGAPESYVDDAGRRILWAWAVQGGRGTPEPGVMAIPRVLTLSDDKKSLNTRPIEELESLRTDGFERNGIALAPGNPVSFDEVRGDCLEIQADVDPGDAKTVSVAVRCSPDGREKTMIVYNAECDTLAIDVSKSSLRLAGLARDKQAANGGAQDNLKNLYMRFAAGRRFERYGLKNEPVLVQEAPFSLKPDEPLRLRIFLDGCMLEVFANGRQALCQQIFPTREDSLGIQFEAQGGTATIESLHAWQMNAISYQSQANARANSANGQ
jgi:beta-fructofuranosidase